MRDHPIRASRYVAFYGCANYPAGYDLLSKKEAVKCDDSFGAGWVGAAYLFGVVIMGAYVLPTV